MEKNFNTAVAQAIAEAESLLAQGMAVNDIYEALAPGLISTCEELNLQLKPVSPTRGLANWARSNGGSPDSGRSPLGGANWGP